MEQRCPQCGAPLPSGELAGLCPACLMKQGAAADTGAAESAAFQPPSVAEVARLFPQLEIIALIGKGGMGAVYQARQPALDRKVALKILPPQSAAGPGFVERFNREARALARLNHPNIVAVYEFGQAAGLPYFIMEFVDGLNLRELERAGKLSPGEALQIVPQICEALQFAHDEGIVHRDIKPENILVDKKGRVKIADFGIAKILSGTPQVDLTGTQGAIGTPHYMAPEQMEKPTTVDHRADIFSLGVVFYEMLTGELPLGKFAPPSARKVEVDVRLDDVVLRALEKDPERRYQHASQVKSAVDTIAGSAAPPPMADGAAMAREILARDYMLSIRSCIRRGWKLLTGEFWPFVGITALILALLSVASSFGGATLMRDTKGENGFEFSSGVGLLLWGPLMGGLMFYFLKKARQEPATVETAFCGFSRERFLHVFLAGFASGVLTWLGFALFLLPGIYLLIAWMFTLPLVMDKKLDFWSAMELSRKVVTKHWFKFLGFGLVLFLLNFAGALALIVGVFVAVPLVLASLIYAYEDIFGSAGRGSQPAMTGAAPAGAGPSGTVVMPAAAFAEPPRAQAGMWTLTTKIGLAAVALVILLFLLLSVLTPKYRHHLESARRDVERAVRGPEPLPAAWPQSPEPQPALVAQEAEAAGADTSIETNALARFGTATELEFTNLEAIQLVSGHEDVLPPAIAGQNRGPDRDVAACNWLESAGMDFAFVDAYDGFYSMTRDMVALAREGWTNATPESVTESLHDNGHDVAGKFGDESRLYDPTNRTFGFKTRDGSVGLLQIASYVESPPGVKIRYKLAQVTTNVIADSDARREQLAERLEAASGMTDVTEKDKPLAAIAIDAAKAGELEIAKKALAQMFYPDERNRATHDAALLLAKEGFRKQAIELAKTIGDYSMQNQTLSELAQ